MNTAPMRLRIAGLLLVLGGVITLLLDALGVPEDLLHWSYDTLLSSLDVPPDPSRTAVDIVRYTALAGGILELGGGIVLLVVAQRSREG